MVTPRSEGWKNEPKIQNLKVFCYFFENSYPKVKISSLGGFTEKRGKNCALFVKIRFFPKLALITLKLHHLWSISHLPKQQTEILICWNENINLEKRLKSFENISNTQHFKNSGRCIFLLASNEIWECIRSSTVKIFFCWYSCKELAIWSFGYPSLLSQLDAPHTQNLEIWNP
jgi:hypothetical protein